MTRLFIAGVALFLLAGAFYGCTSGKNAKAPEGQIVILVSLDGYRADYPDLFPTPHLTLLIKEGVRAAALIPSHPTKTFPNHYTIVTGLYPAHHGIVANVMYDPVFEETFTMSKRKEVENARWWEGEPLWVTAEKQGVHAATYFWPGSEAPIQGIRPTFWKRYDGTVPGNVRVDEVLSWLDLDSVAMPRFITLYFSDVDSKGHNFGPVSDEVAEAVNEVDRLLGRLMQGIEARGLNDRVNLIVVSDHGMAQADTRQLIFLDDYVDSKDLDIIETSPMLMLNGKNGNTAAIYSQLKGAHPSLKVYMASEYPASWHWTGHRRIPEMVAMADEGWTIISNRDDFEAGNNNVSPGAHGYDNAEPTMHAFFVARGPAFVEGERVDAFENIHIYPLVAQILGLTPAKVDGSLDEVRHLLKKPD